MASPKNYVWNAVDYAKNSNNQYTWAKELIPKLQLKGTETLLDIGCGDGKITAEIAISLPNGRVVGIDSSSQMINLAKSAFPEKEYPNLNFQLMDARKLAFQEEFDKVFSNAALHWILDQTAVLRGVARSLKAGGELLFQMGGKGNAQDVLGILGDILVEKQWQGYFEGFTFPYAFCSPGEYTSMLEKAGLKPLRVELFPKVMKLNGKQGLAGWIRTTWLPYTERLPVETRDLFVGEIVDRYLKNRPFDALGEVNLGMMRLEVEASKP
jgi:trans-aconitate 2-methyltransferase